MRLRASLRRLYRWLNTRRASPRPRAPVLRVESLEDKCVPASLNLFTGELLIQEPASTHDWSYDLNRVSVRYESGLLFVHEVTLADGYYGGSFADVDDDAFPAFLVQSVVIRTGVGDDYITLENIPSWLPVTAEGGAGSDHLQVNRATSTWNITDTNVGTVGSAAFSSVETLEGIGTGSNRFVFADGKSVTKVYGSSGSADTVDYSAWTTPVRARVGTDFSGIESVVGGRASDTLVGNGTWSITGTNAGALNGTSFSGFENLEGGSGVNRFVFGNGATLTGSIWGGWNPQTTVDYSAYTTGVTVNQTDGWATGAPGGIVGVPRFVGGAGSDLLASSGTWYVTDTNAGRVGGTTFSSFENLLGGNGDDRFVFGDGKGVTGWVHGFGGHDTLDYRAYTTRVSVDLYQYTATGCGSGAFNIDDVMGGSAGDELLGDDANNVLVGNGGNDTLNGRGGRDLLVGGVGADLLLGGNGGDILVAGTTSHDAYSIILDDLLTRWGRTDLGYAERITNLRTTGWKLDSTTVQQDSDADTLTGGGDRDWFWAVDGLFVQLPSLSPAPTGDSTDRSWGVLFQLPEQLN